MSGLHRNGFAASATDDTTDSTEAEMHSIEKESHVEFEAFYGIKPKRVDRGFLVSLSEQSYLPKVSLPPFLLRDQLIN